MRDQAGDGVAVVSQGRERNVTLGHRTVRRAQRDKAGRILNGGLTMTVGEATDPPGDTFRPDRDPSSPARGGPCRHKKPA
ncbi:hypothetical protein Aple_006230 [Acrocarpospora pleiomorpha]|uniref:Uncharacterized protein n=1 Tax=Acrocarpospora pleiomorpha TaxID=90975 RepID=A0A5M3XI55_9ACTN|nr:hypothetical protein Aple_006230 [Acrocarpospora pleiomorpha]